MSREPIKSAWVLGTPLEATSYSQLTGDLQRLTLRAHPSAVDFTNTHIVTLRRHDRPFRELTSRFDLFIPDGMPLVWVLNLQGAGLKDRIYGPTFMRHCVLNSPGPLTHYFLGGSAECVARLKANFTSQAPGVRIVGARHGYFAVEDEDGIIAEINRLSPDFIWVGLGTPKQQAWIHRHKQRIARGVMLAVGFAFDINAGMKPDAPAWMQRLGLTWLYRFGSEPGRLAGRYLKFNSLFLFYLLFDGLRGKAWGKPKKSNSFS